MNGNYNYSYEQPQDLYAEYSNKKIKEAKRVFSRFFFGIALLWASSNLISLLGQMLILRFRPALLESIYFRWFFGVAPIYLVGLPILFFFVKNMKTQTRKQRKMTPFGFLKYFFMANACMYAGSIIGNIFNSFLGVFTGDVPENTTSELISASPVWLIILVSVILAPIVEEFIFRKLMIDRLSRFGEGLAIFASALAFGLFHGNFYQFFYSFLIGLLLGCIYAKTGNIVYSMLLHAAVNFIGSVATVPILKYFEKLQEISSSIENGEDIATNDLLKTVMALSSYTIIQYTLLILGIVFLTIYIRKKLFKISPVCEFIVPRDKRTSVLIGNPGAIVFFAFSAFAMLFEIVLPLIQSIGGA